MAPSATPLRVLLVRSWTRSLAPLEHALSAAGFVPTVTRVDHEPALVAALGRDVFDVVLVDPDVPGCSPAAVEAAVRAARVSTPVIVLGPAVDLAAQILERLRANQN